MAEGHELPCGGGGGGVQGHARLETFLNEYALRRNLVHFEKYYSVCTDLVASG